MTRSSFSTGSCKSWEWLTPRAICSCWTVSRKTPRYRAKAAIQLLGRSAVRQMLGILQFGEERARVRLCLNESLSPSCPDSFRVVLAIKGSLRRAQVTRPGLLRSVPNPVSARKERGSQEVVKPRTAAACERRCPLARSRQVTLGHLLNLGLSFIHYHARPNLVFSRIGLDSI